MSTKTVIGRSAVVRGRVSGGGDLEIAGRVEGDVTCSGDVTIDASGLVAANVSGARVVVRGAVKGDLVASEALLVESGARIVGDLRAPRIAIAPGGLVRGHVETGAGGGVVRPRASAAASTARPAPAAKPAPKPVAKPAPAPAPRPAPPPVAQTSAPARPPRGATLAGARPLPPPPVVPVLKKGTKAIAKKR